MKLTKKTKMLAIIVLAVIAITSLVLVACEKDGNETSIMVICNPETLSIGESARVMVMVNGNFNALSENEAFLTVSDADSEYVQIEGLKITVKKADLQDKKVVITAITTGDTVAKGTAELTIKAQEPEESLVISADRYTLDVGQSATLTITPAGNYTVSFDKEGILSFNRSKNVLSVAESPDTETTVVVKFTSADGLSYGSKTFTVAAKRTVTLSLSGKTDLYVVNDTAKISSFASDNGEVVYSVDSDYAQIVDVADGEKELKFAKNVPWPTVVTVTATLKDNPLIKATATITLHRENVSGSPVVNSDNIALTSDMIAEVGSASIKATGTLDDIVQQVSGNVDTTSYEMSVTMEEGKWTGSWNAKGSKVVSTQRYSKGEKRLVNGKEIAVMYKDYINKNNVAAQKLYTDYRSIPLSWDSQHLWNHMGSFPVEDFEPASDLDLSEFADDQGSYSKLAAFKYKYNSQADMNTDDGLEARYMLTYICYYLTPMLSSDDIIDKLYFVVAANECEKSGDEVTSSNGHIVGIICETYKAEHYSQGTDDEGNPYEGDSIEYYTYTQFKMHFTEVGTAKVEQLSPYTKATKDEPGQAYGYLDQAIAKIKSSKNYTYTATDTSTYSAWIDSDEYEIEGSSSSDSVVTVKAPESLSSVQNATSETGTVGSQGFVTENAVLQNTTIQYTATMDGKSYSTSWSGYKQFDGYFEQFAYGKINDTQAALVGVKHFTGSLTSIIPQFDFDTSIFKYSGRTIINPDDDYENWHYQYKFVLYDTSITKDVAKQISMYNYVSSAEAGTTNQLTIVVDDSGNLLQSVYPYDYGTGSGYVTTKYYAIGETTIEDSVFNGYVARQVPQTWEDIYIKDYYYHHSTLCKGAVNPITGVSCPGADGTGEHIDYDLLFKFQASYVMDRVFGSDAYANIPAPTTFIDVFGDTLNIFFDYKDAAGSTEDNPLYIDYITMTFSVSDVDDNSVITEAAYKKVYNDLVEKMGEAGYTLSTGNSTAAPDDLDVADRSNRYITFTNGETMIVFENNYSRYFWCYIYKNGDWALNK